MSTHYVEVNGPPPGISSFTKIRLGWISPEQVKLVSPGETRGAFLSPLAQGGDNLVIKIPLPNGKYYLIENRQKIGFDKVQPDSGILVLKVDPAAQEGSGTVRILDADPGSANFSHATFRLEKENRQIFLDKDNGLVVIPPLVSRRKPGRSGDHGWKRRRRLESSPDDCGTVATFSATR